MIERLLDISWKNVAWVTGAFAVAFGIGFLFFVQPAIDINEKSSKQVASLRDRLLDKRKEAEPQSDNVKLPNPSPAEITSAIEAAAARSGMTIRDIEFVDKRAEVASESDPAAVARFALRISQDVQTEPNLRVVPPGIFPTSASGEQLPQSIIVIEILRDFTQ